MPVEGRVEIGGVATEVVVTVVVTATGGAPAGTAVVGTVPAGTAATTPGGAVVEKFWYVNWVMHCICGSAAYCSGLVTPIVDPTQETTFCPC